MIDPSTLMLDTANHWYWDVLRAFVLAGAMLLIVVHVRIAWARWRNPHPGEVFTHPAILLSYALVLVNVGLRRFTYLEADSPPDAYLIISVMAVGLGVWGTVARTRLKPGNTITRLPQTRKQRDAT